MGLDMYLYKKTYIWTNWDNVGKRDLHDIEVKNEKYKHIKPERISEVIEQVGYWRKANHIHKWFVDNVQDGKDDCGEYSVSNEKLKELLKVCKEVKEDAKLAETSLPTQSGFFFGGTEYDEYYMNDVDETIKILEEVLSEKTESGYLPGDIYYHSSW